MRFASFVVSISALAAAAEKDACAKPTTQKQCYRSSVIKAYGKDTPQFQDPGECCKACANTQGCLVWEINPSKSSCWLLNTTSTKGDTSCTSATMAPAPGPVPTPAPKPPSPPPGPTPISKGPNIISIISDDLGYFDMGALGNKQVKTPNLDDLMKGGLRLKHHYAYKYCSPSRRAFVVGRWPLHINEMNQKGDIDLRMKTLGDKLSSVGYKTALFGKTHWNGKTEKHLPFYRGWQTHIGYLGGGEAYYTGRHCKSESTNCNTFTDELDYWHNDKPAEKEYLNEYSTDQFSRLAVQAIEEHDMSRPLWIHLNYQAVHNPQTSPPGQPHYDDDGNLVFLEVLQRMDDGMGNVTAALRKKDMWENTLIVFLSDNGGAGFGNNYPLRGGKYSNFEGGMRTLAFMSGGFLPSKAAGTTFDGLVHISDWYPTLCALAGVDGKDDPASDKDEDWFYPVDGFDVWSFMTSGAADPRAGSSPVVLGSLETSNPQGGSMIIGRHKFVIDAPQTGWNQPPDPSTTGNKTSPNVAGNSTCVDGKKEKGCLICSKAKPCLYDVWADDAEVNNLADKMPELVKSMSETYAKLVFNRRMPASEEYNSKDGWNCKSKWGNYDGPSCVCTKPDKNCKVSYTPPTVAFV